MNHFSHHTFRILKLTLMVLLIPFAVFGQELQERSAIEREVAGIIGKYAHLVSAIKPDIQPDPVRPFRQLFRNVKVKIYNDLDEGIGPEMLSIIEYAEKLKTSYPDGLSCEIDFSSMKIGDLPEITDARKVVEVKVKRTITFHNGQRTVTKTEKVTYQIGYDFEDGRYKNLLIHGITPVSRHDHDLIISFSPSFSKIHNSVLASDARFNIPWKVSWSTGVNYQYMINNTWGIGTGLSIAQRTHSLSLDKLDPFKGHNPNLMNIEWLGKLTYLELPLYGVYNIPLGNKILMELKGGGYTAFRTFESITTEGRNAHSGDLLSGIISDPFNYENISNFDIGIKLGAALRYHIGKQWGLLIQAGYKQGLMSLEKETDLNPSYSIYEGQYNPMFYNSGSASINKEFYLGLGINIRINGNKYFN